MRMMEMYGLWLHAYSSQGSAASLGGASSSSSVRLYCKLNSANRPCEVSVRWVSGHLGPCIS